MAVALVTRKARVAKDGTPKAPKPFKAFNLPSFVVEDLDTAEKLIEFFEANDGQPVADLIKAKIKTFV